MIGGIKALFYGEDCECAAAEEIMRSIPAVRDKRLECRGVSCHDELFNALNEWKPTMTIVLADGAAGMEGVFTVKDNHPRCVVFWFSNDHDFGMMSHRLECAYFSTKPLTEDKLHRAFRRCAHVGLGI